MLDLTEGLDKLVHPVYYLDIMASAGSELLTSYLRQTRILQKDLARRLHVSEAHLSRLLRGHRRPSRDLAVRLATATDGTVSVAAWSEPGVNEEGR